MGFVRVLAELQRDSLIPADVAVNTWYAETLSLNPKAAVAETQAFIDSLATYYTFIQDQYGLQLTGDMDFIAYDLSDPTPRVPFLQDTHTIVPSASGLPGEVALCMSYQADPESGINQARRRGRVFIGPLQGAVQLIGGVVRPDPTVLEDLRAGGAGLLARSEADPLYIWSVYSPTIDTETADLGLAFSQVTNGWVDNSYDTMRKRGPETTARVVF